MKKEENNECSIKYMKDVDRSLQESRFVTRTFYTISSSKGVAAA